MKFSKNVPLKLYSTMKKNQTDLDDFESQNFEIFDIFTQLTTRLKNFLRGWLLILGLKEGLVECATVCVKSEVILLCILYL